ncbi:MAG TPA: hypothetical protein VNJ01_15550 [Bacteriovoracaceae bacterium]|nr:hypothetical protein [Bacteriovoracaceae bacterium]
MPKSYTAINVQYPISELILKGEKVVETRTYPIPPSYLGNDLLMIETPGPKGSFQARIVAIIRFDKCAQYSSLSAFRKDFKRHRVANGSKWDWTKHKPKWGWEIVFLKKLTSPITFEGKKGIVYTKNVRL